MSYNRQLSPGGRRLTNPGRTSDSLIDPYRHDQRTSTSAYTSPRTTVGGVIPISTQTFVNIPTPRNPVPDQRYDTHAGRSTATDAYSGRPRRSSVTDAGSAPALGAVVAGFAGPVAGRNRPTVVQDLGRPSSPRKTGRDKDFYVTPAVSKEPRKVEHKKLYSVNDGTANLVADVNMSSSAAAAAADAAGRHHRRRDSNERGPRPPLAAERDRGRNGYHLSGSDRSHEKSIDDEGAYSYTDPASMYRETEPRWRGREVRPRRGSVDRGVSSRERPVSMLAANFDPRQSLKDVGPPPSTRGWDKINDGIQRARSVRDPRDVPQSPIQSRVPQSPTRNHLVPQSPPPTRTRHAEAGAYGEPGDRYYVSARSHSTGRRDVALAHGRLDGPDRNDSYGHDERREPRHHERRNSVTRAPDPSLERRGFGIRADSQDRYGRGSDESFDQTQPRYRDSAYAVVEPHRRDTAPEMAYHDASKHELERKERIAAAERMQNDERERQWEREARDKELKQQQQRDENRGYDRERDRDRTKRDREYDVDRERERERQRMMEPHRDHERHHQRHESNRERDFVRKENGPRSSVDNVPQQPQTNKPGLSSAATGGLAGAAAALGLGKFFRNDDGEKDGEKDRDRDRERDRDRAEREREDPRRTEKPRDHERERRQPHPARGHHSDEGQQRDQHNKNPDPAPGLGFAFEAPSEPPRSALPVRDHPEPNGGRDRVAERDFERHHEDAKTVAVDTSKSAVDADEDWRRRMEQVQRELGRGPDDRGSDSDPDRERRRREREHRWREREERTGGPTNGDVANGVPGGFPTQTGSAFGETDQPAPMRRSFENDSVDGGTASTVSRPSALNRKPSILDQPMMMSEPAQIIDNSMSDKRENRVRIVDPPTAEEEERRPKGILKKPTAKFPEETNVVREGVSRLKDAKGGAEIPPGARWTKIDRRLVNPEALEDAQERFEERLECVIVLRVLTKEEIQKLADRTREIRDERYEEEREERRARRHRDRNEDRARRGEYLDEDSEDEYKPRAPMMLEAPGAPATTVPAATSVSGAGTASNAGSGSSGAGPEAADFVRENRERRGERDRERERERDGLYTMSGGLGRRGD